MPGKQLVVGLLALLLAACTTVRTEVLLPPAQYLEDCSVPMDPIPTNGALARRDAARLAALEACNADKAALRAWAADKEPK